MKDRQVIRKIKGLESIKPDESWVALTRERILGQDFVGSYGLGQSLIKRPIPVFLGAVFLGILFVAGIFVLNYQNNQLEIAEKTVNQEQELLSSLRQVEATLESMEGNLASLQNMSGTKQSQAIAMLEVVKATAKEGEKTVERIKKSNSDMSPQVLASLNQIKETSRQIYDKSQSSGKLILENCLADLGQREASLNKEDQVRLQKAKEDYEKGDYNEALLLVERIYNSRYNQETAN